MQQLAHFVRRSAEHGGLLCRAAAVALQVLQRGGIGDGVLTPIEVLVAPEQAPAAARAAGQVDGVRTAVVGGQPDEVAAALASRGERAWAVPPT